MSIAQFSNSLPALSAVAANTPPARPHDCATSGHPAAPADAASGAGYHLRGYPVEGVEPVAGWRLFTFDEVDGDMFATPSYFAKCEACERTIWLDTARFRFTPSQDRFAYLVNQNFPKRPTRWGGWDDFDIEHAMATASESTVPMVTL